jgi:hypothetical protein
MLTSSGHVALWAVWVKNGGNRVSSIFILAPQQGQSSTGRFLIKANARVGSNPTSN